MCKTEERYIRRGGEIHNYFELSYANFLVLPRTVMMDMPTEWQKKFVALLDELDDATNWRDELDSDIEVHFKSNGRYCEIPEKFSQYRHPEIDWLKSEK